ncbi:MAG: pyridoxal-dependent decarboxylase [Promethearchaeota archaeon]
MIGTRPGAAVISFWALIKHLGVEGYRKIVSECMENAHYLEQRIGEIEGVELAANVEINVVGIKSSDSGIKMRRLEQELRRQGWALGYFDRLDLIRVVCMPHVKRSCLDEFSNSLQGILKFLR